MKPNFLGKKPKASYGPAKGNGILKKPYQAAAAKQVLGSTPSRTVSFERQNTSGRFNQRKQDNEKRSKKKPSVIKGKKLSAATNQKRKFKQKSDVFEPEKKLPRFEKSLKKEPCLEKSKKEASNMSANDASPAVKKELRKNSAVQEISAESLSEEHREILEEEGRRRLDRNKKSLFVKNISKKVKPSDMKELHEGIIGVRYKKGNAWLIFSSESACEDAHFALSEKKIDGQTLQVDFCGPKAKHQEKAEPLYNAKNCKPIDMLQLVVNGLPRQMNKEKLRAYFPEAKSINIFIQNKYTSVVGFVKFHNKLQAQAAFDESDTLTIDGRPVDVNYLRIVEKKQKSNKKEAVESKHLTPNDEQKTAKKLVEAESGTSDEGSSNNSNVDSSEKGSEGDSNSEDQGKDISNASVKREVLPSDESEQDEDDDSVADSFLECSEDEGDD